MSVVVYSRHTFEFLFLLWFVYGTSFFKESKIIKKKEDVKCSAGSKASQIYKTIGTVVVVDSDGDIQW
jgi:hypothetical protein